MNIWDLFEYTIMVTVVGLLIWVVKLIFHDKLDARWHYFIWLVLLVRLAVPVNFKWVRTPLSVFQGIPVGRWMKMGELLTEKRGYGELFALLGRIYLWGVVLLSFYYLVTWLILRVRIGLAPKADEDTVRYVNDVAAKYGLKSYRDIRVCKSSTPYICGALYPVLVLPEDNTRPEEPVILHELLHGKYRDVLVNIVVRVVRVVNWFNPILWMLTAVVQNDSEALCDQRVLEYCGGEKRREYGEMLISMSEGKRQNPIRTGTSNMASSYRNMKKRIRRIGDFRKLPSHIGFVTLCITLMLAVAGIGSSAEEEDSFSIPQIDSQEDLEKAMVYAQCYRARTPEEAVYLFLRACRESNLIYRMAVMPEDEVSRYEEFTRKWFENGEALVWADLNAGAAEAYPSYLPEKTGPIVRGFGIYNLQYDEEKGSAAVCAELRRQPEGESFVEWKLALVKEDGWKVWLTDETEERTGEYRPEPLLYGCERLGDFLVEVSCYNEGYFLQLGDESGQGFFIQWSSGKTVEDSFPTSFSMEYKCQSVYATYLGEESLEGHIVKAVILNTGDEFDARALEAGEFAVQSGSASSSVYGDSDGNGFLIFDGEEWMTREPKLLSGGGTGFSESGWGWKAEETARTLVQIYIDGTLVEEGEVWSKDH